MDSLAGAGSMAADVVNMVGREVAAISNRNRAGERGVSEHDKINI